MAQRTDPVENSVGVSRGQNTLEVIRVSIMNAADGDFRTAADLLSLLLDALAVFVRL